MGRERKFRRLESFSREEREDIARDYIAGMSLAQILINHRIGKTVAARMKNEDRWEERKESISRKFTKEELDELEAIKRSAKKMILSMMQDCYEEWKKLKEAGALPKFRFGEIVGSVAKLADAASKLTDDGDPASQKIEIVLTGSDPSRLNAITTEVLDDATKRLEDGSITEAEIVDEDVSTDAEDAVGEDLEIDPEAAASAE